MKDVLFQRSEEWVKKHLAKQYEGRFVRIPVHERPELTGEGQKVLFTDGQKVIAESVITEVKHKEVRFEPLTPVRRPNPCKPEKKMHYVDAEEYAEEFNRYTIDFMGITHGYKTLHDLVKTILKKRPGTRNSVHRLKHVVWTEVQDLDLNDYSSYENRIEEGNLWSLKSEFQVQHCLYPPTEADAVKSVYQRSNKAHRYYQSMSDYMESVKEFYREKGEDKIVERLEQANVRSATDSPGRDPREVVKERVLAQY